MKVRYKVVRAPKQMEPNKVYGARVEGLTLNGTSITIGVAIFGHKRRASKAKGRK
jgi:hypothetical protein